MQKFTRALTREIEVGGERLAVTLDEKGLTVRPVGARRPPHTLSWAGFLCACAGPTALNEPDNDAIQAALQALRAGGPREKPSAHAAVAASPAVAAAPATTTPPPAPAATEASLDLLLPRLDRWLATHRHGYHAALRPGASAAECDHLQQELGLALPAELRTWLSWHNGQGDDYVGAFEESWNLMSIAEIASAKKQLDAEGHPGWNRSWLPFLTDDRDDYLCLDASQPGSPVHACWRGQEEHPVVAPSLTIWVERFVAALERGAYHEDPERGTFLRREGA